jgi:hypothetical protein
VRVAHLANLVNDKNCASRAGTIDFIKRFSEGARAHDAGSYRRSSPQITTSGGRTTSPSCPGRPLRAVFVFLGFDSSIGARRASLPG